MTPRSRNRPVRANVADDFRDADFHFSRAYALDTTFHRALLWAASSVLVAGYQQRYDSLAAQLGRLKQSLSPVDRALLERQHAFRADDKHAQYVTARRMSELAPPRHRAGP